MSRFLYGNVGANYYDFRLAAKPSNLRPHWKATPSLVNHHFKAICLGYIKYSTFAHVSQLGLVLRVTTKLQMLPFTTTTNPTPHICMCMYVCRHACWYLFMSHYMPSPLPPPLLLLRLNHYHGFFLAKAVCHDVCCIDLFFPQRNGFCFKCSVDP